MTRITGWLAEGAYGDLLRVEPAEVELAEEDLGVYRAPALRIRARTTHPRTAKVEPKGMRVVGVIAAGDRRIVGARGRVDVTCGAGRAILLRMGKDDWRLLEPRRSPVELTEDAFAGALTELFE